MSEENVEITRDATHNCYVLLVNGQSLGAAYYQEEDDRLIFTHTEVDPSLKGKGLGSQLARGALDDAKDRGKKIVPVCEFIAAYVGKHSEWDDVVVETGQR